MERALLQLARVKNVDNTKGTATIIADHINLKSKVPQETYNFLYGSETQHHPVPAVQ